LEKRKRKKKEQIVFPGKILIFKEFKAGPAYQMYE
jgi:hypothetical protein